MGKSYGPWGRGGRLYPETAAPVILPAHPLLRAHIVMLSRRTFTNTLLVILSICALPPAVPDLFTYGEQRGPDERRTYGIGTRWTWTWDPVRVSAVARYVGDTSAAYQTDAQGWLWVPKIEGRATIYYGPSAWQREVELR